MFFFLPTDLLTGIYVLIEEYDLVIYYRPQRHPSHYQHHPEQLDGLPVSVCHLRNGHGGYHVCGCREGARRCEAVCVGQDWCFGWEREE